MTEELAAKRLKISPPLIGTHKSGKCPLANAHEWSHSITQKLTELNSGHFHADEALAVFLLRLLPAYSPSALLRTRDTSLLSTCHTVVDVGGEYNPSTNRYDHHQRTFNTTFPNHTTKLSSAGLVYMHFGKPIISQQTSLPEASSEVSLIYEKLYTEFVEALDAHDNGISAYDPKDTASLKKRFNDSGVTIGSMVNDLNSDFDEGLPKSPKSVPTPHTPDEVQHQEDARFLEASQLMGTTFLRKLSYYHKAWLPARSIVQKAYSLRHQHDPSGQIIVFDNGGVPWKDHIYLLESTSPEAKKVLYVLYPEGLHEGAKWRVQCVSVTKDSFESRRPLKEEWRGVRDEELASKVGIKGCVFVHASGFIGGNQTKEGALQMARLSMAR
ncbi:hypothetical protein MMC14_010428 [Varicellaria rhodocarpa]|nr:hypothetical protein [Varicellaria rhodocarpa]